MTPSASSRCSWFGHRWGEGVVSASIREDRLTNTPSGARRGRHLASPVAPREPAEHAGCGVFPTGPDLVSGIVLGRDRPRSTRPVRAVAWADTDLYVQPSRFRDVVGAEVPE